VVATSASWRELTVTGRADGASTVPLRPMTIGDLLDEPFIVLRAHLRSILLFAAAAVVPSQLLQGYLARGAFAGFDVGELMADPEGFSAVMGAESGTGATGIVVALANGLLLLPIAVALISRLGVSSILGERLSDRQVIGATLRRLPALAGTWALAMLVVLGVPLLGAVLAVTTAPLAGAAITMLGLPLAFVAFVLVAPAPLVAVVERRSPIAALQRAVALMRPRFWVAAGALALALTVSGMVQLAIASVPSALAFVVPERLSWVVASAGSTIAGLVATPYTMLVVVLLYVDALVRRDALDVQRLLEPVGPARG
jgi:hypothetical protein